MKKLFKDSRKYKEHRKDYRIKPTIKFIVDNNNCMFSFLPTIVWQPWIYRYPNMIGVIDIWWLNFHIIFGRWEELSCRNCKNQDECVKSKRIEWYFDNVFENGGKCSDFKVK